MECVCILSLQHDGIASIRIGNGLQKQNKNKKTRQRIIFEGLCHTNDFIIFHINLPFMYGLHVHCIYVLG